MGDNKCERIDGDPLEAALDIRYSTEWRIKGRSHSCCFHDVGIGAEKEFSFQIARAWGRWGSVGLFLSDRIIKRELDSEAKKAARLSFASDLKPRPPNFEGKEACIQELGLNFILRMPSKESLIVDSIWVRISGYKKSGAERKACWIFD
ncbi:unnamed protein product [Gordionus sp. m RMFG-2023]